VLGVEPPPGGRRIRLSVQGGRPAAALGRAESARVHRETRRMSSRPVGRGRAITTNRTGCRGAALAPRKNEGGWGFSFTFLRGGFGTLVLGGV